MRLRCSSDATGAALVLGTRSVTIGGHTIQLALVSDLDVMSARIGEHLLMATAEESNDATSVLMGALASVRG